MHTETEIEEQFFRNIYDTLYDPLCRFANLYLRDSMLAEEAVSDVIFSLWKHRERIDSISSIHAYLMKAVRNQCINELNSLTRRSEMNFSTFSLTDNKDFLDSLFEVNDNPLTYLLQDELEQQLYNGIESLPQECRTVFKKSREEQKIYEDIANELGISVNTVKYHIKNALATMHKHLSTYMKLLVF